MSYLKEKLDTLLTLAVVFGPVIGLLAAAMLGYDPVDLFTRLVGSWMLLVLIAGVLSFVALLLLRLR